MLNLSLAQINFTTGDIAGNTHEILTAMQKAVENQVDILVFPELALSGYPPEDLLLRRDFHDAIESALHAITQACGELHVVLGYPEKTAKGVYNSAIVLHQQKVVGNYRKQCLPNYGVFDEQRYFTAHYETCVIKIHHVKFGLLICEDLWQPEPLAAAKAAGAQVILSLNASPFDYSKSQQRHDILRQRQKESGLPIAYVNLVGGQDELVFDGGSFALNKGGDYAAQASYFSPQQLVVEIDALKSFVEQTLPTPLSDDALIYQALVLGTHDYIEKNGFPGAVLGLSGGIDSALTLAITADAIGADKVQAVMMPSRYTADMSLEDAEAQATTLGVIYSAIPIERAFSAFTDLLSDEFIGLPVDTTEQNIQARCRGILLMAISNKTGKLVVTTGNKSEMSVGYATLYGDMAGGYGILKDVPKMLVYRLANYRNTLTPVIPQRVIDRPPSAELAHEQLDEHNLPPYPILDAILERYVELDESVGDIVLAGYEREVVEQVVKMIKNNEHTRRQAAPGPRVTPRAHGRDRRYPITSGF
jgi:NAD+ synthase (glutamine-hydrolysing)